MDHPRRSGFTLIELSIVLVIVGLLVGGVLSGHHLIRVAELRGLLSEVGQYEASVNAFRLKYDCLPGDCINAADLLPDADNGNGDGIIVGGTTWSTAVNSSSEGFGFWQQLASAGLVSGTYEYTDVFMPGLDCPRSLGSTCPFVVHSSYTAFHMAIGGWQFGQAHGANVLPARHLIQYGNAEYSPSMRNPRGALNGQDLISLDIKADDGRPYSGIVQTLWGYNTPTDFGIYNPCLTDTGSDPSYQIAYEARDCPVYFVTTF
jgi:prepilin-type N-terminal cleavage/methylation domain-containing protein